MSYPSIDQICPIERIADALRRVRGTTKEIAQRARRSPESVKNWRAGNNAMSAAALIILCREFDEVWDEVKALAGRDDSMTAAEMAAELARRLSQC